MAGLVGSNIEKGNGKLYGADWGLDGNWMTNPEEEC